MDWYKEKSKIGDITVWVAAPEGLRKGAYLGEMVIVKASDQDEYFVVPYTPGVPRMLQEGKLPEHSSEIVPIFLSDSLQEAKEFAGGMQEDLSRSSEGIKFSRIRPIDSFLCRLSEGKHLVAYGSKPTYLHEVGHMKQQWREDRTDREIRTIGKEIRALKNLGIYGPGKRRHIVHGLAGHLRFNKGMDKRSAELEADRLVSILEERSERIRGLSLTQSELAEMEKIPKYEARHPEGE